MVTSNVKIKNQKSNHKSKYFLNSKKMINLTNVTISHLKRKSKEKKIWKGIVNLEQKCSSWG